MDERPANWDSGLDFAILTDVGLRRTNNQDSSGSIVASSESAWRQRGHLFVVADGMGAHAAGELASKLATDTITHLYHKKTPEEPFEAALRKAIEKANEEIHGRGKSSIDFHGMGTTSSCLLLTPAGAIAAHVGDSRIYRLRGGQIEQLTFDHSLVWEMMANGQFRDTNVAQNFPKNIITRSLGPNPQVQVDLEGPFPIALGDTFLLCSDGLTGQVKDEELGIILACLPPKEAVRALIDLANLRGGPDNITVEVARVTGQHIAPSSAMNGGMSSSGVETVGGGAIWIWLIMAVLVAAAAVLLALGQRGWAIAPVVLGVLVVLALLVRGRGKPQTVVPSSSRGPLGRGPYVAAPAVATKEFVDHLAGVNQQLRDAATHKDWAIDWSRVNAFSRDAEAAAKAHQWPAAVQNYCRAISFMMGNLAASQRKKKGPAADDASAND
jgi:PPM family protein phosphatase